MKVWKVASKSALMTRQVCQEEERMILKLNFQSEVPIYQQICNQIIYWISTGELKPGEKLPTVRGLAEEAGINSMTVSKAYQQLKAEGYLVTERRNGVTVSGQFRTPGELSEEDTRELVLLISRARIAGVPEEKFLELCESFYDRMAESEKM